MAIHFAPNPSSSSVVLAIHEVDNVGGRDLMEHSFEAASVKSTTISVYPDDFPYKNVVDFTIVVHRERRCRWRSTTDKSLEFDDDDEGLIDESTEKGSFSIPFYSFLFSTVAPGGVCLSRLRRFVALTNLVRPEYCDLVAQTLCAEASQFIQARTNTKSFLVKLEIDVVRTIEYPQLENRGRKRKGLCD